MAVTFDLQPDQEQSIASLLLETQGVLAPPEGREARDCQTLLE